MRLLQIILMLCMLPDRPLFKVNLVTGLDVPYNVCYFTGDILYYKGEYNSQWHGPGAVIGQDDKQILVKHGSVYACVHACRISHAIDNDNNNGSNNIGHTAENAPNLYLSDSKNIDQINRLVTDSDDTDIEDKLESDVLSNLGTLDKDEENISKNNVIEHNQGNTADKTQNSNLESISQLTKSIEWLSLDTNVNDQIPLTHNSDKLPKPSHYVEFQLQNENEWNNCQIISRAGKATGK